ncbi:MAG: hypothetical protein DRH50_13045 [Deltaproteobacteria bacterium]|nr:MAG: hypothetical protein DRH50_13045 [Deltaproteobacteria bacterium]
MPCSLDHRNIANAPSFRQLYLPIYRAMPGMPPLESRGDRPLKMTFEDQLKALIFFHLEEHTSARHLLQILEEDDFARGVIAPEEGIKKSSFARLSIPGGLNSSFIYTTIYTTVYKHRPLTFYQKGLGG